MTTIDLANLGSAGTTIFGIDSIDVCGHAVSNAGDFNGDGFDDVIISAPRANGPGNATSDSGECYLIFGGPTLAPTIDLSNLGAAGVTISSSDFADLTGNAVSAAGDVNGDGFDDVIIGAPDAGRPGNPTFQGGTSYVVFGSSLPASIDVANLGAGGITIFGADNLDKSGHSVSGAGDVNGDGFDDLIIGAYKADGLNNAESNAGKCYVIFGAALLPVTIDLSLLGSSGITIFGVDTLDYCGNSVSSAGDINGDGFDDFLIGAFGSDGASNNRNLSGETHVVFGNASLPATIDLTTLGAAGVTIFGAQSDDISGQVSAAGDVNGDGFDDLLVGSRGASGANDAKSRCGESYIIFGALTLPTSIDLALPNAAGVTIFGVDENDFSGFFVSDAGDVNGDGFSDWIIGAPYADGPTNSVTFAGECYVLFGGNFTNLSMQLGASGNESLQGNASANIINGAGGNDTLNGNGGADVLLGGQGNDVVFISDATFRRIDGGNGSDTLSLSGDGLTLDLTTLADNKLTNIETIDLRGNGPNTLILDVREVLNLTANSNPQHTPNTLTIQRDVDDGVTIGDGWTAGNIVSVGRDKFQVFTQGAATLLNQTFSSTIDLASLGNAGTTIFGADTNDRIGFAVSNAGDINGDGFDDIVVASSSGDGLNNGRTGSGETYLIFGGASLSQTIELATLGATGITIFGADVNDDSGESVSGAGDVNGDGFDDLIIGATGGSGNANSREDSGECYIIFGGASLPATIDLATLGSAGIAIFGAKRFDHIGQSVSGAGDVNGDGFDDVIIGASRASGSGLAKLYAGESYVIFGGASLPATIDLATLGTAGISIPGVDLYDNSGNSVSTAGDMNGDGFDDLLIGALHADGLNNGRSGSGETYVILGAAELPATIDLANLTTPAVTIFGIDLTDFSGYSVSSAGDVNGDGFDDVLIGAALAEVAGTAKNQPGETYVIFGSASLPATIDLATLGAAGITLFGVDDEDISGCGVSNAGDVNGDGFGDLLIGAREADASGNSKSRAGETYVIFGSPSLPAIIDLTLTSVDQITIFGKDQDDLSGCAVSSAGDVNGDGFDDWLIGAAGGDGTTNAAAYSGETYLIFGGNFTQSVTHLGTSAGQTLTGDSTANVINGARGNDKLIGAGGADVLLGGQGDDTLSISDLLFRRLDGGNGLDTLTLGGSGLALDLTTLADNRLTDFETLDLRDGGANTLTLNLLEVLNLTANSNPGHTVNTLTVRRDQDDTVNIGPDWTFAGTQTVSSELFSIYTQGAATLKVTNRLPVFTSNNSPGVQENQTAVTTVVATDADLPGQTVTYSISGGADQARFSITSGGVLTFVTPPDFESPTDANQDNVYVVQVTADDGNGGIKVQTIAVSVIPVNEASPVFGSDAAIDQPENLTSVTNLSATDSDLPAQTVTYAISGGADAARFVLTGGNQLEFASPPDFEIPSDSNADNVYELQVTASDGQGRSTIQNIVITVTPLNDNVLVFTSPSTFNVLENATAVGTTVATDADLPAPSVTYSITGGADAVKFAITSGGVLTFVSAPDFENPTDAGNNNVYDVQVTADAGLGGSATQDIAVVVTDFDETPLLALGGGAVTWIKKQPPVAVLPQVTVHDTAVIGTRTLTINVNAVGTARKLLDQFRIPPTGALGTSTGAQFANGRITLQVQLNPNTTSTAIQSFLRGITFATKGKGLKTSTRTMNVTLTDTGGPSGTIQQTINVRKKAP